METVNLKQRRSFGIASRTIAWVLILAPAIFAMSAADWIPGAFLPIARADSPDQQDANLRATFERDSVALDESAVLSLTVVSNGFGGPEGEPRFKAPDFDVLNQYSSRNQEVRYIDGKFTARTVVRTTIFLRPRREGTLTVSGIEADVDGKTVKAQPLTVKVLPSGTRTGGGPSAPGQSLGQGDEEDDALNDPAFGGGAGSRPPRGYGGAGSGLRGTSKRPGNPGYFLRAEVDKQKVYKGEQLVVSYWLYTRQQVTSVTATKYPVLNGFLREDLEIPIVGSQLRNEQVVLDGVLYTRALLARYAAYPIQTGKVPVDSMAVDLTTTGMGEDDDMLGAGGFGSLFRMMMPGARKGSATSDSVSIDVMPLPEPPAGTTFGGGVGRFTVTTASDRTDLKAGEALTYTVKIEGRGSLSGINPPKLEWPDGLEPFETRSQSRSNHDGTGSRTFEYVVIPRKAGSYRLPHFETTFFDPALRSYATASGAGIDVTVQPGAPGSEERQAPPLLGQDAGAGGGASDAPVPSGTVADGAFENGGSAWSRWVDRLGSGLAWTLALLAAGFAAATGGLLVRRLRREWEDRREGEIRNRASRQLKESKSWTALKSAATSAAFGEGVTFAGERAGAKSRRLEWDGVVSAYERLCGAVFDAIEARFPGIGARSLPRAELGYRLTREKGVSPDAWARADRLLEFAEAVRFASDPRNPALSAVSEADARRRLAEWVEEGMAFERLLS